ncbi:hypothetical protein [uncultured Psychroserpens sp.]|uniref:DUF4760 domain-containing protein n=1 Tax=uncultured Psychroserpens sp. TaxID=255436 RepID=UPI002606A1D1|nr:hypothetical protein [uncultured Psychroserpens sp.]
MDKLLEIDFSLVLATVALIISFISFKKTKDYNSASFFMELIREFRSPEFVDHRLYVKNQLSQENITVLSKTGHHHVMQLCHYFDTLALLVNNKLIKKNIVKKFLGKSIYEYWVIVEPYIKDQREKRNFPDYQEEFEKLALSCKNS